METKCLVCNGIPIDPVSTENFSLKTDGEKLDILKVICHFVHVNWDVVLGEIGDRVSLCPRCLGLMVDVVNFQEKLRVVEAETREKLKEIENIIVEAFVLEDKGHKSLDHFYKNSFQNYFLEEHETKELLRQKIFEFNSVTIESRYIIEVEPSFVQMHLGLFENSISPNSNPTVPLRQQRTRRRRVNRSIQSRPMIQKRETRARNVVNEIKNEPPDFTGETETVGVREDVCQDENSLLPKAEHYDHFDSEFAPIADNSDEENDNSDDSDFELRRISPRRNSKGSPRGRGRPRKENCILERSKKFSSVGRRRKASLEQISKPIVAKPRRNETEFKELDKKEDGRVFFENIEIIKKPGIPGEGKFVLSCGACGREYADQRQIHSRQRCRYHMMKRHITAVHLGGYKCQICYKDFCEPKTLAGHMYSKHGSHKLRNPMGYEKWPKEIMQGEDDKMYYRSIELVKTDLEEGYDITCTLCDKTINSMRALRRKRCPYRLMIIHVKVAHGDEYKCDVCGKKYTDPRNLDSHRLFKHTANPPIATCDICGKPVQTVKFMRDHQWSHKNDDEKATAIASGEKPPIPYSEMMKKKRARGGPTFQCTECGKTFESMGNLRRHENTHKDKTFQCSRCGKSFVSQERLNDHTKFVHDTDLVNRKHYCKYCPKFFTTRSHWMKHERQHTGEIPFSCPICFKGFALKQSMNAHAKKCTSNPRDVRVSSGSKHLKHRKVPMPFSESGGSIPTNSMPPQPHDLTIPPAQIQRDPETFHLPPVPELSGNFGNLYTPFFTHGRTHGYGNMNPQSYM